MTSTDFEFYETPQPFTDWLYRVLAARGHRIHGHLCEPCVGDGAIVRAMTAALPLERTGWASSWTTNDLDPRWAADRHLDASRALGFWSTMFDWVISNPPFTPAIDIITLALAHARVGVAMHLRASIHEVLKTGARRTWMRDHTPTGILWLPRFAYQRSRSKGAWTTDSVCACWCVWLKTGTPQFIEYAPESVLTALDVFTPGYRDRMDRIMGLSGLEATRQHQCVTRWQDVA